LPASCTSKLRAPRFWNHSCIYSPLQKNDVKPPYFKYWKLCNWYGTYQTNICLGRNKLDKYIMEMHQQLWNIFVMWVSSLITSMPMMLHLTTTQMMTYHSFTCKYKLPFEKLDEITDIENITTEETYDRGWEKKTMLENIKDKKIFVVLIQSSNPTRTTNGYRRLKQITHTNLVSFIK
jgi:hypothetical protein